MHKAVAKEIDVFGLPYLEAGRQVESYHDGALDAKVQGG